MRAAYRNDEDGARLLLDALLDAHRAATSSIPERIRLTHARRLARSMAGIAAMGCAGAIALVGVVAILTSRQIHSWFGSGAERWPSGRGELTLSLLCSWLVVAGAYVAGRLLSPIWLRRE